MKSDEPHITLAKVNHPPCHPDQGAAAWRDLSGHFLFYVGRSLDLRSG